METKEVIDQIMIQMHDTLERKIAIHALWENEVLKKQVQIYHNNTVYYAKRAERKQKIIQKIWDYVGYIEDAKVARDIIKILDGD